MGLPPIINHGSKYLKDLVVKDVLSAKKFISIAISEPSHGSDVANIMTTATRDGEFYVVNGQKKWISWAIFADFFTVAVRTGGKGSKGVSLLLIEKSRSGVSVQRMKLQGNWLAGTCLVTFEDVRVPVKNLIGKENEGFKYIMHNFNYERFTITCGAIAGARLCIEEALKYALQRTVFDKKLIEQPVIRAKFADMVMRVQCCQSQLENIAYQMKCGSPEESLGGPVALLKTFSTKTFELCAREASQILGGASYVRGGKGVTVERLYRDVRGTAIPGGSEEILADLGVRQEIKTYENLLQKTSKL